MIISLRSAFSGAGVIASLLSVAGSPALSQTPFFTCPVLGEVTGNLTLCSGEHTTLAVSTDNLLLDIEFVYFGAPRPADSVYMGGQVLGLVASATFSGSGFYTATLNNAAFPAASLPDTFYVYARLSLSDPDLSDPACRPFVKIAVVVNPLPLAAAGPDVAVCPGGGAWLSASGGASCSWAPANGLSKPDSCITLATPSETTTYTLTVTNGFGCVATDATTVKIHVPGAVVCNENVSVSLGASGAVTVTPDMILEGTYDGFDVYSVVIQTPAGQTLTNPLTCARVGQSLLIKITDTCNGSACWSAVTVEDKLPPALVCRDTVVPCAIGDFSPAYLSGALGIAAANPAASDNCGLKSLIFKDSWETVACGDSLDGLTNISARLLRRWTATDVHGNKSSCEQSIFVERRHLSAILFPADTVVSCEQPSGNPAVTGTPYFTAFGLKFPLVSNNNLCDIGITYEDERIPVCDGTTTIRRHWTAVDWCYAGSAGSDLAVFDQLIKITDDHGPAFMCPPDMTVSTGPTNCCAAVDLPDVTATDDCSRLNHIGATVALFDFYTGQPSGMIQVGGAFGDFPGNNYWTSDTLGMVSITPCLPRGEHIVTYSLQDDCGNSTSCSFRLSVSDQIPPVAACVELTQVALGLDGTALIDVSTFDAASYDNCSELHFKARRAAPNSCQPSEFFHDQVKFCCEDAGDTIAVIFRVSDRPMPPGPLPAYSAVPNYNECTAHVLVEDKIKPSCLPPANVTVTCENFDLTFESYGFAVSLDNCCLDTIIESRNYAQFDTVCHRGTIIRTFRPIDCTGNTNPCTQRIVVHYQQDYWIKFPDDKIVTFCDGTVNFGEPIFQGDNCELLGVSFEDVIYTVVTDACYKIERTWTIINWCSYDPNASCIDIPNPDLKKDRPFILPGPIVSPPGTIGPWAPTVVKILPTDPAPTDYSIFWDPDANCYRYKQVIVVEDTKDPKITGCPANSAFCDETGNDPQYWSAIYWHDKATNSHDLCEGPVDLSITASDFCSGTNLNFKYLLMLDLDADGTPETVVNGNNLPAPGSVNFGNAANPNFSGGTFREYDQRPVSVAGKWNFALQTAINGSNVTASLRWNTMLNPAGYVLPELPYGTHRIKWIVEDGCGNESVCEYDFTVKDCKAPTVVCINGLSVNMMPTQMIQLWATDFLQYAQDNCTPPTAVIPSPNLLQFALEKTAGSNGVFPLDDSGQPRTNVAFGCAETGEQSVRLWARDLAGNADYCQTTVTLQDNAGYCAATPITVAGAVETGDQEFVEDVQVNLKTGSGLDFYDLTDHEGRFSFSGLPVSAYTVTPAKDDNPLNGVSTFDLVLISKHLLGLKPLGSPYRMIAADANRSNSITSFDLVEFRKLILGIYTELPQNTSWRFVDKNFTFPQPDNPFQSLFPEAVTIGDSAAIFPAHDFVAVKTGDVNGSALTSLAGGPEGRASGTFLFDLDDREVQAGEEFWVKLSPCEPVEGWQFTLNFNGLEVLELQPGTGLTKQNFALFSDALTASADGNAGGFALRCRALQSGALSQMLSMSSRITRAEAYVTNDAMTDNDLYEPGAKLDVALRFHSAGGSAISGVGFELYQNQPNPFEQRTIIGFHLPESSEAAITVFDASGRVVFFRKGLYSNGYNTLAVDRAALGTTGILYCRLETATESAVRKMVLTGGR